ncbi:MAG: tRNA (adenosine(37)-N6)-threonylcarbamoyltransferase complex transferase subunit TsaD, partial [Oscillospiraceae bacterium]
AKGLCLKYNKPLIPVHHIKGHIASNYLSNENLKPPFLCLIVSGGHSHILEVFDYTKFNVLGMTRDDAAGEAFDKAARTLGFGYPGGILLDKLSQNGDENAIKLPIPQAPDYDFSFSGLKTAVINYVHNATQKNEEINKADVAASFQSTVSKSLCKKTLMAAKDKNYKVLAVAGGVSANSTLRRDLKHLCEKEQIQLYLPQLSLCGDNGAMIASQGYYEFISGTVGKSNLNAIPYLPVDEKLKF